MATTVNPKEAEDIQQEKLELDYFINLSYDNGKESFFIPCIARES